MKKIIIFSTVLLCFIFNGVVSAEYIDNSDGTITDASTNLMWQKSFGRGTWDIACDYCNQSATGGYSDWRLPDLTELQLLVDPTYENPCIYPLFACLSGPYWTTTVYDDSVWVVVFSKGYSALKEKSNESYVRCVRDATTSDQYDVTGIWQMAGQPYFLSLYITGSAAIAVTYIPGEGESYMLGTITGNAAHIYYASDLSQFDATVTFTSATTATMTVNSCVPFSGDYCILPAGTTVTGTKIF